MSVSRARFDENVKKYSHCCCHIRIAAYVVGVLHMVKVFFDLARYVVANMGYQLQDEYGAANYFLSSSNKVNESNNSNGFEWISQHSTASGILWDMMIVASVATMFIGIRRVQPLFLIPQMILNASFVGMGFAVVVAAIKTVWTNTYGFVSFALMLMVASLYFYSFHIATRTYRYLVEKRRFLNDITNIFISPSNLVLDHLDGHLFDTQRTNDVPPAYQDIINEEDRTKSESGANRVELLQDQNALPTYEESLKLQHQQNKHIISSN